MRLRWFSSLVALAMVMLVATVACQEGKSVFDLEVGDCVVPPKATGDESLELGRIHTVDCSEPHDGEVIALFDIEGDEYPGEEAVVRIAEERCPPTTGFYLYPLEESWNELNDREVVCARTSLFDLQVGDCIRSLQEGLVQGVERVDCSEPHDGKVIAAFDVPDTVFPGEDALIDHAEAGCPPAFTYYLIPTEDSWATGDREITCIEE